mgnify:CR=1 FL=1
MGSAKQRISGALILTLGASMLVGCELPERNTQVKSIKIGVTLYDQYDAFLSELMEDFNTYAAAKEEETESPLMWKSIMRHRVRRHRTIRWKLWHRMDATLSV